MRLVKRKLSARHKRMEVREMAESIQMKVYGAWLFQGVWDGVTPPPGEDWKLLNMKPGKFSQAPPGCKPKKGQVTLLMQGVDCLVVTPE